MYIRTTSCDDGPTVRSSPPLHIVSFSSNLIHLDLLQLFVHAMNVCGALSSLVCEDLRSKNVSESSPTKRHGRKADDDERITYKEQARKESLRNQVYRRPLGALLAIFAQRTY